MQMPLMTRWGPRPAASQSHPLTLRPSWRSVGRAVTQLYCLFLSLCISPSKITISVSNTMFNSLNDDLEFALIAPVAVVGGY